MTAISNNQSTSFPINQSPNKHCFYLPNRTTTYSH